MVSPPIVLTAMRTVAVCAQSSKPHQHISSSYTGTKRSKPEARTTPTCCRLCSCMLKLRYRFHRRGTLHRLRTKATHAKRHTSLQLHLQPSACAPHFFHRSSLFFHSLQPYTYRGFYTPLFFTLPAWPSASGSHDHEGSVPILLRPCPSSHRATCACKQTHHLHCSQQLHRAD